jgi:hypothetical protein
MMSTACDMPLALLLMLLVSVPSAMQARHVSDY